MTRRRENTWGKLLLALLAVTFWLVALPALAQQITGVFTIDGRELARQTIPPTIPLIITIDETFDVGIDTRTGVDDSYTLPFRFTGTIDKLTFKLGPEQLTAPDQKAAAETAARAKD